MRLQTEKTARSRAIRVMRMSKHWIDDIGCCRRRVKDPRCILLARDPDQVPHIIFGAIGEMAHKGKGKRTGQT